MCKCAHLQAKVESTLMIVLWLSIFIPCSNVIHTIHNYPVYPVLSISSSLCYLCVRYLYDPACAIYASLHCSAHAPALSILSISSLNIRSGAIYILCYLVCAIYTNRNQSMLSSVCYTACTDMNLSTWLVGWHQTAHHKRSVSSRMQQHHQNLAPLAFWSAHLQQTRSISHKLSTTAHNQQRWETEKAYQASVHPSYLHTPCITSNFPSQPLHLRRAYEARLSIAWRCVFYFACTALRPHVNAAPVDACTFT